MVVSTLESVAQSVEQRTFNPWVESSSLSALIAPKPCFLRLGREKQGFFVLPAAVDAFAGRDFKTSLEGELRFSRSTRVSPKEKCANRRRLSGVIPPLANPTRGHASPRIAKGVCWCAAFSVVLKQRDDFRL